MSSNNEADHDTETNNDNEYVHENKLIGLVREIVQN